MANSEHVELVLAGAQAVRQWRASTFGDAAGVVVWQGRPGLSAAD